MSNVGQVNETPKKTSTLEGVVCSNPGCAIAPVYKRVFNTEAKRMIVKKVDETNLYEFIQSSKSETDLATLHRRFVALGEIPAVDPSLGEVDQTIFPNTIHELYGLVNDLNKSFDSLPDSIKKIFGTSDAYGQAVLDGSYSSKLAAGLKAQNVPEKDVNEGGNSNE